MTDLTEILKEFGSNLVTDIQYEMEKQGLGESNLSKSLEYEVNGNEVTVTSAPYLRWAEKGRGPGKVPYKFEDILLDWMERYHITPKYGTETQFANAIKWKTIREGSSIYRGERPERDFTTEPIDKNLEWLEEQAATFVLTRFVNPL